MPRDDRRLWSLRLFLLAVSDFSSQRSTTKGAVRRPSCVYAGHDQPLGAASPLWRLMAPTTSRRQLRRREAGWEGSRRRNRDSRYTNRIRGGTARASQHDVAKPDAIKGPSRKCGGCARKVAGLIPGDLHGCRGMPDRKEWKRPPARRRNLRELDIPEHSAREWAGSSKGPWRIAGSYVLQRALPNAYWTEQGLCGFTDPRRLRDAARTAGCGPACPVVWEGSG